MVVSADDVSLGWFVFFSETLPSLAIAAPILLVMFLFLAPLLFLLALLCCETCMTNERVAKAHDLVLKYFQLLKRLMHYSARRVFLMKPSQGDTEESPKTEMFGYVVPHAFLLQVFSMVAFLSGFSVFAFINTFFVKESHDCVAGDPDLACFTVNASNMTERVNCSTIDSTFNDSTPDLLCYEFVFQTTEALSAAGGIYTIGGVSFAAITTCILFISSGEDGCESPCKPCCICAICTQVTLFFAIFGLLITIPFIDIVGDQLISSANAVIQMLALSVITINAVAVPWCLFEKAPKAPENVLISVNLPPQSFPIKLPDGPPDDGDEDKALVRNEAQSTYQSIEN